MKIKFNIQEIIQKEYELDLADSEKVIRRAKEIKAEGLFLNKRLSTSYYYERAIQDLLDKDEICATLVDQGFEEEITCAWEQED